MMSHTAISSNDLALILTGDVTRFNLLREQKHDDIAQVVQLLPLDKRVLRGCAVRRVLASLLHGEITPAQAQSWASFVRRGYLSTGKEPVCPVDIPYEKEREDEIVEAISRLDELGDAIDGTIEPEELRSLINRLPV